MDLKIISGDIELDVYDDTEINLTFSIEDILNLDVRRSSASKDFILPGTKKNREFFQNIQETNISVKKSFLTATPVKVLFNDKVVIIGSIRLLKSLGVGNDLRFQVQVTGIVRDFISELEKLEPKDLDFSRFNHIRNTNNIISSWSNSEGYVYPYIINGRSNDIFNEAYVWDLFPSLFVKDIIDELFNKTGFQYESKFFESDYFRSLIINWKRDVIQEVDIDRRIADIGVEPDTINVYDGTGIVTNSTDWAPLTPVRNRATSWWNSSNLGNRFRLSDTTTLDFRDDLNTWQTINVGFAPGPVGTFPAGRWQCGANGVYDINFVGYVFPQYFNILGGPVIYNDSKLGFEYNYRLVHIKNNGTQIVLDQTPSTLFFNQGTKILQDFEIDTDPNIPNMQPWRLSAQGIFLEEGDVIQVRYSLRFPSLNFAGNNNNIQVRLVLKRDFGGEFSRFFIRPAENQTFGNEFVDMNRFFEDDTNLKSLFLDLVKMFNLIIAPDKFNPNKVIIEPREDYWLSRKRVKYWEFDKMSQYSFTPMSEVNFNRYVFKYLEDSEYLNESYKVETGKEWASRLLKIENDYSEIEAETKLSVLSQSPLTNTWTNDRIAPFFVSKEANELRPRNVNLKIFFYTGTKPCEPWFLKSNITSPGLLLNEYPYCGHFDDPLNPTFDLNFGPTEKIYHNQISSTKNDLFNKFWRSTFNQLIDKDNKLLVANFYLTSEDIADLDYRDIILIDGGYWRINKIENWSPNKLTKVELYKINISKTYDVESISIPQSNRACPANISIVNNPNGQNYYESPNGPITKVCCDTLGGIYDGGVCYLYEDTGVIIDVGVRPVVTRKPLKDFIDLNTVNKVGTTVVGKGNYVSKDSGVVVVSGNDTSSVAGSKDSYAFGDGITVDRAKNFYINDVAVDQDGDIVNIKPYIINGGKNTTLPASRSNVVEVVHGGVNAVRNSGGDVKKRVLIADVIPDIEIGSRIPIVPITNEDGTVEIVITARNLSVPFSTPQVIETSVAQAVLDADLLFRWNFPIPILTNQFLPQGNYYIVGNNTLDWTIFNAANATIGTVISTSTTCVRGDFEITETISNIQYKYALRFYTCPPGIGPLGDPTF